MSSMESFRSVSLLSPIFYHLEWDKPARHNNEHCDPWGLPDHLLHHGQMCWIHLAGKGCLHLPSGLFDVDPIGRWASLWKLHIWTTRVSLYWTGSVQGTRWQYDWGRLTFNVQRGYNAHLQQTGKWFNYFRQFLRSQVQQNVKLSVKPIQNAQCIPTLDQKTCFLISASSTPPVISWMRIAWVVLLGFQTVTHAALTILFQVDSAVSILLLHFKLVQ